MKSLLIATVLAFSFSSFADQHDMDSKPFEDVKKMMIEGTELRISHLQAAKACMEAAKDRAEIKQCKADLKAKRKEMKGAMESKREAFKAQRDAKKANKKK